MPYRILKPMEKIKNLCQCSISFTLEEFPSRPSVDSKFSSRIVWKSSPFNQLKSLGGRMFGCIGATRGVWAGTKFAGVVR